MDSRIGIVIVCCGLAGCVSRYPLGMTREQWDATPPERQAEYQARQYQIDADRRARAEESARQEAAQRAEQARLEAEQVRQAYANARYGDVVTVAVQGGYLSYAGKRYPYEPVAFDLIRGESKEVAFRGRGMQTVSTEYVVRLSEDGNTLFFDDESSKRAVFVNHDWEHGERYLPTGAVNDVGVGISGMTFLIRYKNLAGAPRRVIIENR